MSLLDTFKNLFSSSETSNATLKKLVTIDTYSSIESLFNKKELKSICELIVKGPARAGKGDELFDFIKQVCIKHKALKVLDLRGIVGLSEVKEEALKDCSSLTKILLPEGIIKINTEAFKGCSNLEHIEIQEGVERILESVFSGCKSLKEIKLPKSLYRLGKDVFEGDEQLTSLIIPSRVESIGRGALNCPNLRTLTVEPHNPSYITKDNVLYSRNGSALIAYAIGKPETEYTLPNDVAKIGEYSFANCRLKKINFPNNVNIISRDAFRNSALTELNIPTSIERIDDNAFENCRNLQKIKMQEGLNSIGKQVFKGCVELTEVNIPKSVLKLGDEGFMGCSKLAGFKIPTSVEFLGKNVLKGTPSDK